MIAVDLCEDHVSPDGQYHFWYLYSSKQLFLATIFSITKYVDLTEKYVYKDMVAYS